MSEPNSYLQLSAISDLGLVTVNNKASDSATFLNAVNNLSIEVTQKDNSNKLHSKKVSMRNLFELINSYIQNTVNSASGTAGSTYLQVNGETRAWKPSTLENETHYAVLPLSDFAISNAYGFIKLKSNGEITLSNNNTANSTWGFIELKDTGRITLENSRSSIILNNEGINFRTSLDITFNATGKVSINAINSNSSSLRAILLLDSSNGATLSSLNGLVKIRGKSTTLEIGTGEGKKINTTNGTSSKVDITGCIAERARWA